MRLEKMLSRVSELPPRPTPRPTFIPQLRMWGTLRDFLISQNFSGIASRFGCRRWRELWLGLQRCDLHCYRLAFTFATLREPRAQTFSKALRSQTEAGFDLAIRDRQSVVEFGGVGEIAHAELIEPFERAGLGLAANHDSHIKFLCVHGSLKKRGGQLRPPERLSQKFKNYEARGRFTECARPMASSIQMKYQPMSGCHQRRPKRAEPACVW
jgi:hypothetical protein